MKNFIATLTLLFALSVSAFAQTPVTKQSPDRATMPADDLKKADMDRYLNAKLDFEVSQRITEALALDSDQLTDFQPLYTNYSQDKDRIEMKRRNLVKEYMKEMREDDTAQDEENETADFVENYWELDIDAMKLKKDYFDRLEDIIGTSAALDFFRLDEMYTNRLNRMRLKAMPTLMVIETPYVSYSDQVNDYRNWNRVNIDGKVDVSHEFTANGLTKLWNTVGSIARAEGIAVNDFDGKKDKVMMLADKMQKDWTSMDHADQARQAFTMTAEALKAVSEQSGLSNNMTSTKQLMVTAQMIDPNTKLTDQAQTIYSFFNQAERIVNTLVEQANR